MARVVQYLQFLLLASVPIGQSIPQNGNFKGETLTVIVGGPNVSEVCVSLVMQANQPIRITLDSYKADGEKQGSIGNVKINITSQLKYSECADVDRKGDCGSLYTYNHFGLVGNNSVEGLLKNITKFLSNYTIYTNSAPPTSAPPTSAPTSDLISASPASAPTLALTSTPILAPTSAPTSASDKTKRAADEPSNDAMDQTIVMNQSNWYTFKTPSSAVYVVEVYAFLPSQKDVDAFKGTNITLTFHIEMINKYGYLSLVDYPAMIVFSLLLVVYVFYAFLWLGLMACYFRDIVRLQFWVAAVILLGFLEKVFFVSEYSTANQGLESWGLIYIAEGVSAAKRALARMLIIIICEGFGTVKPRLGATLPKVLAVGALYFVMAFVDGIVRSTKSTVDSHDLTSILTFAMLILIDTGIVYWVFSALVNTRRTLRLRKNLVKLTVYNHLTYALVFTCVASVMFLFWEAIEITTGSCTTDWKELWLMDCYWHILFCFILFVIMVIWRPSANKLRFAYVLVSNDADDEEIEQGPNKNFETVKMRPVNKLDSKVTSVEAEEDLKWVEENLPTTAIDKALPLVLDTDEEVMTTTFEVSKMN